MSPRKQELLKTLEQQARVKRENRLRSFMPYAKQKLFMALGATHRERMLSAATQGGKSTIGAVEMAYHLTGDYPAWFEGRRFDQPVTAWTAGESAQSVRMIQQTKLLGTPGVAEALGTGFLPKSAVLKTSASHGVADSIDSVLVRHASGGISSLAFLSYEKKREKFQGASCHVIWLDEECPMDIYSECLGRITATQGILYLTATPLSGMTDVIMRFFNEPSPDRALVQMDITEAEHIPPEEREKIIAGYLPHEREARSTGRPMLGAGKIFLTPEDEITIEPFEIPPHFFLIWGCDFGTRHPAAFVLLAHDRDLDIVYVVRTLRMSDALFMDHAQAVIRSLGGTWAREIPVAWPQDGTIRREFEGELQPIAQIYKHHGLKMLSTHAKEKDGSMALTEAGVQRLAERFATGKLKVFNTCPEFFEEYRMYHRDTDGKIVKVNDDVLSALRTGVTMLRSARNDILFDPTSPTGRANGKQNQRFAKGSSQDPYGW
jgi:phage terminase large subunit-like protein